MASPFADAVRKFAEKAKRNADEVTRESMRLLYREVIDLAPQDTGYLRASVKVTTGAPLPLESNPPERGGSYSINPAAALAAVNTAKGGEPLFLSVTASYAPQVEYGTSRQRGQAFMGRAVQRWPSIVAQATAKVTDG